MKKAAATTETAAHRRSAMFGLAEHVWNTDRARWIFRLRLGRITLTLATALTLAYFGVAGAKYAENKWVRDCETTSYAEICLFIFPDKIPFTKTVWVPGFVHRTCERARESHRAKLAASLLARAKKSLQEKAWGPFFQTILHATKLDPKNKEARLLGAQALFALRRDDDAMEALELSLSELIGSQEFVSEYVITCLAKEQDKRLVGITKHLLANPELKPEIRLILTTALAKARFNRGEFDECTRLLESAALARSRDAFMIRLNMLTELGNTAEAIRALESVTTSNPDDSALVSQLIALKKESGDLSGARNTASIYSFRAAQRYQARTQLMDVLHPIEDKGRLEQMIADYRRDFGADPLAMVSLCEFASHSGMTALCESLYNDAIAAKFTDAHRFKLLEIESNLANMQYEKTVREVDQIFITEPTWLPGYRLTFDALRMVAHFALGREDTGEIALKRIFESKEPLNIRLMEVIAGRLIEAGRQPEAIRVINGCRERSHGSLSAHAAAITIHLRAGGTPETPALLRSYLQSRRPSRKNLLLARQIVGGDAYLFEPGREALITDIETLLAGKPVVADVPATAPKKSEN